MVDLVEQRERDRLAALQACAILDTPAESSYDDIARMTARMCATPIALITLLDAERIVFKAQVGCQLAPVPRQGSLCEATAQGDDLFVVHDARCDKRFADNPSVTGPMQLRFYAGAPIRTETGLTLGTLCIGDRVPRTLTDEQRADLQTLANLVADLMLSRRRLADLQTTTARLSASEHRFRAFMDNSPAVAVLKDSQGRFRYVNAPCCRRFKIAEADWLGKTDRDLWPAEIADELERNDAAVMAGDRTVRLLEAVPDQAGNECWWQVDKFPFTDETGERFLAVLGVEVTAERQAENALKVSEARYRDLFDNMQELVQLVDSDGRLNYVNPAWRRKLGYTEAEVAGLRVSDIVPAEDQAWVEALYRQGLGGERLQNMQGRLVTKSGELLHVEADSFFRFENGKAIGSRTILRDVTERKAIEAKMVEYQHELEAVNDQLRVLADTDGLTGLKNRAAFDAALFAEMERAKRYDRPISVVMLDVDHFKSFNDAFGHPAGDEVLRAVASMLADTARTNDFVARYGGEEFVILLPDTDASGAMGQAERFRRTIAAGPWSLRDVTISLGVATFTGDDESLVELADAALYTSKDAGRNRVTHAERDTFAPAYAVASR